MQHIEAAVDQCRLQKVRNALEDMGIEGYTECAIKCHEKSPVMKFRGTTFRGFNGDDNAHRLVDMLRQHSDDPAKSDPFGELFKEKLASARSAEAIGGRVLDALFLVHSYINNIRELFEEHDDQEALALLHQVEAASY